MEDQETPEVENDPSEVEDLLMQIEELRGEVVRLNAIIAEQQ